MLSQGKVAIKHTPKGGNLYSVGQDNRHSVGDGRGEGRFRRERQKGVESIAEKKYKTAAALRRASEKYFDSISRTVPATELYNTGRYDKFGHFIYELRNIENDAGEGITYREYAVPPSITELCTYLGICRETWRRYISTDEEWAAVGAYVKQRIRGYLLYELMTRRKGLQGVIFNLQNNYSEGEDIAVGSAGGADELTSDEKLELIRRIAERVQSFEEDE